MLDTILRFFQRYGFFKREPEAPVRWGQTVYPCASGLTNADVEFAADWQWQDGDFYTAHKAKNERLAQIARERDALKLALTKAKRDKKAVSPIYLKLRALSVEELNLESGK